jgi:hypothetical protein
MGTVRIKDTFHDHPMVFRLLAEPRGAAALGVWVKCVLWASREGQRVIPADITAGYGDELVQAGFLALHDDGYWLVEHDFYRLGRPRGKRGHIGRALRLKIYERDGYRCVTCGSSDRLSLDHIKPVKLGGSDAEANLQTMCRSCNSRKGARVVGGSGSGS